MKNIYPLRKPDFTMVWSGCHMQIISKDKSIRHELNSTAAAIWLLCDGKTTVGAIEDSLIEKYPRDSESIGVDLRHTLEKFQGLQLVSLKDYDEAYVHAFGHRFLKPVIRVGFGGFWSDFQESDNYFISMLADFFDVMVVVSGRDDAELFFYTDLPENNFDHTGIDRNRCLKVLVTAASTTPDLSQCDYVLSDRNPGKEFPDKYSVVPIWVYFLDLPSFTKATAGSSSAETVAPYYPQVVFADLFQALFAELVPDEKEFDESRIQLPRFDIDTLPVAYVDGEAVSKKLSIAITVTDNIEAAYFTVQALRLYHQEVMGGVELLVVDNNPAGHDGKAGQNFMSQLATDDLACRYIPNSFPSVISAVEVAFLHAGGETVLCLEAGVMLEPGGISKLLNYLEANPDCRDLLHGILRQNSLDVTRPAGGQGALAERGSEADGEPFDLPLQGMEIVACRREAWLGINPRLQGFSGVDWYLTKKYESAKRRILCLPFLGWVKPNDKDGTDPATVLNSELIHNYYLGAVELGLDPDPLVGACRLEGQGTRFAWLRCQVWAELVNPFSYFDAIYCIVPESQPARWHTMRESFRHLGISARIQRLEAIEAPESSALAYRKIIGQARLQRLKNVLIFEDTGFLGEKVLAYLEKALAELKSKDWQVLHIGLPGTGIDLAEVPGSDSLHRVGEGDIATRSVAFSNLVFQTILDDLPERMDDMRGWLASHVSPDQYLQRFSERYLASPRAEGSPPEKIAEESVMSGRIPSGFVRRLALEATSPRAAIIKRNLKRDEWGIVNEEGQSMLLCPVECVEQLLVDDYAGAEVWYFEAAAATPEQSCAGKHDVHAFLPENIEFRMVLENITSALLFFKLFVEQRRVQDVVDEFMELYRIVGDEDQELAHDVQEFYDKFQYLEYVFPDA